MKKLFIIFMCFILLCDVMALTMCCMTEDNCKEYILKHKSDIVKDNEMHYSINKYDGVYYTDITIAFGTDSSYQVIFWGDRDSWMWRFRADKDFNVDIPYNRYKGIDTKLDEEILKIRK